MLVDAIGPVGAGRARGRAVDRGQAQHRCRAPRPAAGGARRRCRWPDRCRLSACRSSPCRNSSPARRVPRVVTLVADTSTDELDPDARATVADGRSMSELDHLLASREMVLVGGIGRRRQDDDRGGARGGRCRSGRSGKVLVLTVDPARRLATALGLESFGNTPVRVPADAAIHGIDRVELRGELWAAMLDTKAGWDELIRRHAPDAATRDAVLANPLYENITSRFVHSHEYLAMEQLHDLHATGQFDLVIVDTPPSRNALSILDAPSRMVDFFGSRLLRWLTVPYRSRLFTAASKPFYQVADRVLGSRFLQDIADFFVLFQAMEPGFVRRAREVEASARRSAHRVRRRHHARDRAESRGPVPRPRARRARTCRSVPSSPTGCCRARSPAREARGAAQSLVDQADGPLATRCRASVERRVGQGGRAGARSVGAQFDDLAMVAGPRVGAPERAGADGADDADRALDGGRHPRCGRARCSPTCARPSAAARLRPIASWPV